MFAKSNCIGNLGCCKVVQILLNIYISAELRTYCIFCYAEMRFTDKVLNGSCRWADRKWIFSAGIYFCRYSLFNIHDTGYISFGTNRTLLNIVDEISPSSS
jgi:hypothetical protein